MYVRKQQLLYVFRNEDLKDVTIIGSSDNFKELNSQVNAGGKEKWIPYIRYDTWQERPMRWIGDLIRLMGIEKDTSVKEPKGALRLKMKPSTASKLLECISQLTNTGGIKTVDENGEPELVL